MLYLITTSGRGLATCFAPCTGYEGMLGMSAFGAAGFAAAAVAAGFTPATEAAGFAAAAAF